MNTKDKIIETTFLLSLEYGYDNVSIKQIKEKSKTGSSSIYYHFKDKNDILDNMIRRYLINTIENHEKNIRNFKGSFLEKVKALFYYSIGVDFKNHKKGSLLLDNHDIDYKNYYLMFYSIYHQHPAYRYMFNDLNSNILEFFIELIEKSKENNEIGRNINSEEISLFIYLNLRGFIDVWLGLPNHSIDDIVNTNIRIIQQLIE